MYPSFDKRYDGDIKTQKVISYFLVLIPESDLNL